MIFKSTGTIDRARLNGSFVLLKRSEFKCNVCNHNVNECGIGNNYDFCKPQIIEHVIYNHPLHCYSCGKCEQLFVFKKDFLKKDF